MGRPHVPVPRAKLVKIDDSMKRWCAVLDDEVSSWPLVKTRAMFGMTAYYRHDAIFAAIPRTRAVGTPFSILIKRASARTSRLQGTPTPGRGWNVLEMQSESDIAAALKELGRAYDAVARAAAKP